MSKTIKILFLFALWLMPALASAQGNLPEKIFPAEVVEVIKEEKAPASDGGLLKQQDLKLKGLEGEYKDKIIEYKGIGMPEMIQKNVYEKGDKVLVEAGLDEEGRVIQFFITDHYRLNGLFWLSVIFILSLFAIGRWKGVRSLIALALTFLVIMKYILPQIIDGADPIAVTLIGSLAILLLIIYTTEGFRVSSHLTIISILCSLILTVVLSWIFVDVTQLSGLADEEAGFLIGLGGQMINFKGLLLAGIIIGALGVLDDVVVSQVTAVKEIHNTDPGQSRAQIFKKAFNIGTSHISSMTNTLFLAYAGASLPLLMLFLSGQSAFSSSAQALNNETLATEIVRTLAGSIGLISAVPISTLLATLWFKK